MSDTDEFLAAMIPRQVEADKALNNGDAAPRMALWSRRDPVTLLRAAVSATGWEDVSRTFEWLATTFSDCESFELDIIAAGASGDLALRGRVPAHQGNHERCLPSPTRCA
jgi:limonene-1,2-epoxide hydrolase